MLTFKIIISSWIYQQRTRILLRAFESSLMKLWSPAHPRFMRGRRCSHSPLPASEDVRLESNYFFANVDRCEKPLLKKIDTEIWILKRILQNPHLTVTVFCLCISVAFFYFCTNTVPIQPIFASYHVLLFNLVPPARETESFPILPQSHI